MSTEPVDDPVAFFTSLAGLRDTCIESIAMDVDDQILYLFVDDLYWSQEGTPDYPGERRCALIFLGVAALKFDVEMSEGLQIGSVRAFENADAEKPYRLEVDLKIGGVSVHGKSITAQFAGLEIEDAPG